MNGKLWWTSLGPSEINETAARTFKDPSGRFEPEMNWQNGSFGLIDGNPMVKQDRKAVAILRISSRRQEDGFSHSMQEQAIREYCQKQNIELVKVEAITESAKTSEQRTKYQAILKWTIASEIKNLIFYKIDRECRNLSDAEKTEALAKAGVLRIHYVVDGKVYDENTADSEYLFRDINTALNKHYVRDLSTKINAGMRQKAREGWYPSNSPPLGYVTHKPKDESGKVMDRTIIIPDPDPKSVRLVRREFELKAQGKSVEEIRRVTLSEQLVPLAKQSTYKKSSIHCRLTNPFYWGRFIWQGEEYPGKHELIIPTEHLQAVQGKKSVRGSSTPSDGVFAGGWLRCGHPECGCVITFDPKQKKIKATGETKTYRYYHCANGRNIHPNLKGLSVTEDSIWSQLSEAMSQITITPEMAKDIADALNETREKTRKAIRREVDEYRLALKSLDTKTDSLFDMFQAGTVDEETYRRQSKRIKDDRARFTDLLEQAQLKVSDAGLETAQTIFELAINAKSHWLSKSPVERRADLEKVLSNPVLDGPTVRYEIKKPFRVLSEMAVSSNWWTRLDDFRTACQGYVAASPKLTPLVYGHLG